jgi:nucleoside-diphosphate-sugar epimerase
MLALLEAHASRYVDRSVKPVVTLVIAGRDNGDNVAMRVLVTGAAGTLASVAIPRLVERGHDVVGLDVRRGTADCRWTIGDVRDAEAVSSATEHADVIVHAAAFHGIHLSERSRREFYELNVTGTFNVWEAAVGHEVRGVLFSSTMGVYGDTRKPVTDHDVTLLDEELPLLPGDVYGWTKLVGEELCRFHGRANGVASIALRFGMFVPEPFFRYGIRLLYGGVHEEDVADSVVAAVDRLGGGGASFEALNVESPLPFAPADAAALRHDPLSVLDRHWPGASDLLRSRGVSRLQPITEVFPIGRLQQALGLQPSRDFGAWLRDLERRPNEHAQSSPPWP